MQCWPRPPLPPITFSALFFSSSLHHLFYLYFCFLPLECEWYEERDFCVSFMHISIVPRTVLVTHKARKVIFDLKKMNDQLLETVSANIGSTSSISGLCSIDSSLLAMYHLLNRNRKLPFVAISLKITSNTISLKIAYNNCNSLRGCCLPSHNFVNNCASSQLSFCITFIKICAVWIPPQLIKLKLPYPWNCSWNSHLAYNEGEWLAIDARVTSHILIKSSERQEVYNHGPVCILIEFDDSF